MKKINHFTKLMVILLLAFLGLTACVPTPLYQHTDQNIQQQQYRIDANNAQYANYAPPVLNRSGIYANTKAISLTPEPSWYKKHVDLKGVDLPFSFYATRLADSANMNISFRTGLNTEQKFDFDYTGTLKGAMDALADKTGYSYQINDDTILWSNMVSRTFDISFMPGDITYQVGGEGKTGHSSASSVTYFGDIGANTSEYSNIRGNVSLWNDLKNTLEQLKSSDGKVIVSEATTSVTVYDHPENVTMIQNYLAHLNKMLSRQVALDVKVIEVELNKNFNYGVNWDLVYQYKGVSFGLQGDLAQPVTIQPLGGNASNAAGFIIRGNETSKWFGTNILINALKQQGKVSVATEPRVVTLNNQVAQIDISTLTGYLQEVSTTQTGNQGQFNTETLVPGIVKTGFSLYILPKIVDNQVYLQISSNLSRLQNLNAITARNTDNSNRIEVPTVNEKLFNQRSLVQSGDTLVIAGFKQLRNEANNTRMFDVPSSQGALQSNVQTIVLITPIILGH